MEVQSLHQRGWDDQEIGYALNATITTGPDARPATSAMLQSLVRVEVDHHREIVDHHRAGTSPAVGVLPSRAACLQLQLPRCPQQGTEVETGMAREISSSERVIGLVKTAGTTILPIASNATGAVHQNQRSDQWSGAPATTTGIVALRHLPPVRLLWQGIEEVTGEEDEGLSSKKATGIAWNAGTTILPAGLSATSVQRRSLWTMIAEALTAMTVVLTMVLQGVLPHQAGRLLTANHGRLLTANHRLHAASQHHLRRPRQEGRVVVRCGRVIGFVQIVATTTSRAGTIATGAERRK